MLFNLETEKILFVPQEEEPIYISNSGGLYPEYIFVNHAPFGFHFKGIHYRTVEHFYQSMKFRHDEEYRNWIITAETPAMAANMAALSDSYNKEKWEQIRLRVMEIGVTLKFLQNWQADVNGKSLPTHLMNTQEKEIIFLSKHPYWGVAPDGEGQNMFGKILMNLRSHLIDDTRFLKM